MQDMTEQLDLPFPKRYPAEPYTPEWDRLAGKKAVAYIGMKACRDCGAPCLLGHCCDYCNSVNP